MQIEPIGLSCASESVKQVQGCFWKVSSFTGRKVYILGTVCPCDAEMLELNELIKTKFKEANRFILVSEGSPDTGDEEPNIDSEADLISFFKSNFDEKEILELYTRLKKLAEAKKIFLPENLEGSSSNLIDLILFLKSELDIVTSKECSFHPEANIDSTLWAQAGYSDIQYGANRLDITVKNKRREQVIVKTPPSSIVSKSEEAVKRLVEYVKNLGSLEDFNHNKDKLKGYVEAWKAGDVDKLAKFQAAEAPWLASIALNLGDIAKVIVDALDEKPYGFTVVPLHFLLGENLLLSKLSACGLRVAQVFTKERMKAKTIQFPFYEIRRDRLDPEPLGYILGTIHEAEDKKILELNSTILSSFKACRDVYLETIPSDQAEETDHAGAGIDDMLLSMGREGKKNVYALEDRSASIFQEIKKEVKASSSNIPSQNAKEIGRLNRCAEKAYKRGDLETLLKIDRQIAVLSGDENLSTYLKLFEKRDVEMADRICGNIVSSHALPGKKFFGVGVNHLPDKGLIPGVISLLRSKTLVVTKIE